VFLKEGLGWGGHQPVSKCLGGLTCRPGGENQSCLTNWLMGLGWDFDPATLSGGGFANNKRSGDNGGVGATRIGELQGLGNVVGVNEAVGEKVYDMPRLQGL